MNGLLYASLHILPDTDIVIGALVPHTVRVGHHGHDLTIAGHPDDLTRLAVALLAAATPQGDGVEWHADCLRCAALRGDPHPGLSTWVDAVNRHLTGEPA